jgi:hypothetical protein
MNQDELCDKILAFFLQNQYSNDQSIIAGDVRSILRDVLIDVLANIVHEYIFSSEQIDWNHDPLFDVWHQDRWVEARIVRPGTYPILDLSSALQRKELEREFPHFVEMDGSHSRTNIDGIIKNKFKATQIAAYQSRILHPHSHYYSLEELAIASYNNRLLVCDTDMIYREAEILQTSGRDFAWIQYHRFGSNWSECIPIRSYRFYILKTQSRYDSISLKTWRHRLSDSIKCYHHVQMLTCDLLVSHDCNEERIRASLAQHVCQLVVP